MDYLDFWRKGFKEGKDICLEQINEHCKTNFADLVAVILYINEVKLAKTKQAENVQA